MGVNFLTSNKIGAALMTAASGEVPHGAVASATAFLYTSNVIDTQGFDEITFFAAPNATGAARARLKVGMASATGDTMDDIVGSGIVGTAAHQTLAVSVVKPQKRYLVGKVAATGGVLGKIWYILSNPRDLPVSNNRSGATGAVSEIHLTAATGTA